MTLNEVVIAGATIMTALATGVLAVFTLLLWKATKRMAVATSEPYVVATLEPSRWSIMHMDLVVENSGSGPAFDIQLQFNPPLVRDRRDAKYASPLSGIAVLRPGQLLHDLVGNSSKVIENNYRVTISWKASAGSAVRTTNTYELNLGYYQGLIKLGGNEPIVQIAQELKKFREAFEKSFQGANRVGVDVYTRADRDEEVEEQERAFARMEERWGSGATASAISPEPESGGPE